MGLLNVKGKGFEYSTCKTNCERFEEILAATSTRAEPKCVQLPGADADAVYATWAHHWVQLKKKAIPDFALMQR
jgi:hypothetical protein